MPPRATLITLLLTVTLSLFAAPGAANAGQHVSSPAHRARVALTAPPAGPAPARTAWRWPLEGTPEILRRFSPPPAPWLAGHRGVDLAAPPGSPVLAAGPGSIGFAGPVAGRGVVTVNHPGGLRTTYLPVTPAVRAGDPVAAGDPLGILGPALPHCPESCLHWGLRAGTTYLDPLLLLAGTRVRLLPFWQPEPLPTHPRPLRGTPHPTGNAPPPAAFPDSTRLPSMLRHSATTPLPHPFTLAAPLGVLFLLGLLVRLLRKRTHRHRSPGKHSPRPPIRGQHRKQRRR